MASGGQRGIGHDLVNVGTLEPEKLHRAVLNRCLPQLLMDLDVNDVMMYIQQKELFDAVTIRDINEQTTTTYKISHLIDQIKKRDQNTYVRFKECLILAEQADLKIMLEEEEENLVAEMKEKYRGAEASKVKSQMLAGAKKELDEPQAKVKNIDGKDKDDVDAPITQEHINYARLCMALTTVCSNALREILLINVPMPHADIYKAILANKAKLNKFNKAQVKLVFPDPQGLSTGKVEEFDISLLYTIIRNVSSVPAPSNGWGNPPAENPRDTTLGASVERIRLYRNYMFSTMDGKISLQEFEDFWAKIDDVLREIEIVIGNHGYLEDLKKHKNLALTSLEAHELQKTFKEYKKQIAALNIVSTLEDTHSVPETARQTVEKAKSDVKKLQGTGIPVEILNMDDRSIQLFENALKDGKVKVHSIRVMVVGHQGVGKTTLIKRLLGKVVNISEKRSTEGIDVHLHCCHVALSNHEWTLQTEGSEQDHLLQRVAKVLNEQIQVRGEAADEKRILIPQEGQKTDISAQDHVAEDPNLVFPHPDLGNLPQSNANTMVRLEPGANVSSESHMKDSNTELLQLLQKNPDKIKHDLSKYAPLTIWDFAGQYAFYTTHQMFLSRRAIYLLVSNISKHLDDMVDDECCFDKEGKMKCRVRELVEVWMNSVHSCAPPGNKIMNSIVIPPPVILVGTNADAIPQDNNHEICENFFREIRSHLKDKPSRFHLVEEDFAIDNTVVDSKLEGLKKKIVEVASRQPYWGEEIPASWLPLEQVLMNLRAQGHKVINRSLVENKNQAGGVQISTDELDLFLRFQHEIGTILYFSTELLKEKIVLEPQWMINALKSLITAEMFVLRLAPSVTTMWYDFKNDGKLSPELIDALWTKDKDPDLHDNKKHILLLMEQLNIIAKPKLYIDDESKIKDDVNYFFAPCMLHVEPPREVIFPEHHEQMESSSVMCYVFTGKFLPAPIFHRLLAACVAQWPLATKKMGKTLKNQIFCGCGVFRIDRLHKLTLYFSGYIIFMRVTRQGMKDKTPSSKLCIEVKEFIAKVLNKLIGYLGQSLKFEEFIQCPEYSGEIVHCRIPVNQLKECDEVLCESHDKLIESKKILKFWFDGEVKNKDGQDIDDVDAPITQEHINFARLCNALMTVCSSALREILLTNVPMPHTDINKAILANKAKLKKKLNKEQDPLVFPDPQGLTTGKLETFDISLLYLIIRNVKSVPAPSNGWGKPPTDNPRDTTLGASVERIRTYRNQTSAHSPDGEISQQKFEDYWAKIDEVLREIESVIGNHGYLKDLEKRKNQAITRHEARELQKKFQEYKKQYERERKAKASDIWSKLEEVLSDVKELQAAAIEIESVADTLYSIAMKFRAPVFLDQDLAGHSTQAQTDVLTSAPTSHIMQIPASGSTSSTAVGLIQAPTTNASPSISHGSTSSTTPNCKTSDVLQISVSSFATIDVMQAPISESTTADIMQIPVSTSTTADVMPFLTSPSALSTHINGLMQAPITGSTTPLISTTDGVMQTATLSYIRTDLMQASAFGSTTAVIQAPTSVPTTTNILLATTSASIPSTATSFTPCQTPTSATAVFMQAPSSVSTTDMMQASASGTKLSTTTGSTPCPTSTATTTNVIQTPTSGSTTNIMQASSSDSTTNAMQDLALGSTIAKVMQAPTSGSTAANVMQTPASGSTAANVIQTSTSGSTAANVIQISTSGSTAANVMQIPTSGSTAANVIQTPTSGSTAADVTQDPTPGSTASGSKPSTTPGLMPALLPYYTACGLQPQASSSIQSTTTNVTQAPLLDDTGRFVHIASLLVNVGSKVLRRLLLYHTVTPTCTLDQYLAMKRIDIDKLKKNKILNKSQMDTLFPSGRSTNLNDYDITLLSALFTNIVLNKSHQDLNKIQFLRDKRNEVFAHAKSLTVNSNDYQTFWNDICRTLEALSMRCNDPDFENEMSREIQVIQVTTVQCTSLPDVLQAHRKIETLEKLLQYLISSHAQELNNESDDSDS